MPVSLDPKPSHRRDGGTQPLRRKRVQPAPAVSGRRTKVLNGLLAFATIVLLVDALVGDKGLVERMRARKARQEAEASLASIRYQNAVRREQIRRLREDPSAIEGIARGELGLIRPGELLFIIRDAKPAPAN